MLDNDPTTFSLPPVCSQAERFGGVDLLALWQWSMTRYAADLKTQVRWSDQRAYNIMCCLVGVINAEAVSNQGEPVAILIYLQACNFGETWRCTMLNSSTFFIVQIVTRNVVVNDWFFVYWLLLLFPLYHCKLTWERTFSLPTLIKVQIFKSWSTCICHLSKRVLDRVWKDSNVRWLIWPRQDPGGKHTATRFWPIRLFYYHALPPPPDNTADSFCESLC